MQALISRTGKRREHAIHRNKTRRGFSLVELMVAMALGLVVLAATTQLFKNGMDATILVTQSSEMQQGVRATLNLVAKDVSMAGSGLPPGGLSLPYGAGATPRSSQSARSKAWLANNTYPTGVIGGAPVTNFMFGIIPGPGNGMELGGPATITATGAGSDAVTVIYEDYAFPLNQYTATFPAANPNGDVVNFAPPGGSAGGLSGDSVSDRNSGRRFDPAEQSHGLRRW